jgi:hypothetical protein
MEALVILLAELLAGPILAAVAIAAQIFVFVLGLLFEFAYWVVSRRSKTPTLAETEAAQKTLGRSGRSKVPRLIGGVALTGLALSLGGLLLVNFVFFEPMARWAVAKVGKRTNTDLDFKTATGNIFSGSIIFEDLSARRVSETRSSFDLKARHLRAKVDPWTLVFRPIWFQSLSVETVSGTLQQPERRKTASGNGDDKIKARRKFQVQDLRLKDVNIMLSKGDNAPVAVSLTSVSSAPFRSNYALFDTLFRSNLAGRIDGRDISISTQRIDGGRLTQWRMPDLQAASVSRFVTRPPLGWLREGTLDVRVDDRWQLGTSADIGMDWNIRMQGVRAEAREGAGVMEKTFALPVTSYINGKDGNVDLRFKLVMNEKQFENMSSLDARFLWDVFLQSMAKAIGISTGAEPGEIRQGIDKAVKGFKGFLDRRRKPSDIE